MFSLLNNKKDYSGIDYAMKDIPPIPLSPRQRTNLAKIKPYPFIIIGVVYLLFTAIPLIKGSTKVLPFMLIVATVIAAIIFILTVRDKLKIKSYTRIYIVRGFVENTFRVRGGRMFRVRYYDILNYDIKVITKSMSFQPSLNETIVSGRGVELIMGEKNNKLKFITVKPTDLDAM